MKVLCSKSRNKQRSPNYTEMAGINSGISDIAFERSLTISPAITRSKSALITKSKLIYNLNVDKAVTKKCKYTSRQNICVRKKGGFILTLTTAHYEGARFAILDYLQKTDALSFTVSEMKESSSMCVQSNYTVFINGIKAYVVNLYHTNCKIMVNGAQVDRFINIDWPSIFETIDCLTINGRTVNWSALNACIQEALQSFNI